MQLGSLQLSLNLHTYISFISHGVQMYVFAIACL